MKHIDSTAPPAETHTPTSWVFGDFTFAVLPFALSRDGRHLALRPQSAHLLELLIRNPGRLVDREMIRQHLWGCNTFVDFEKSINFSIRDLRKVLGDSARQPTFIETVHGKGYRFVCPVEEKVGSSFEPHRSPRYRRALAICSAALSFLMISGFLYARRSSPPRLTFATPADFAGSWAGTANFGGDTAVPVQLQVDQTSGLLEAFGEAPLAFDGRFFQTELQVLAGEDAGLLLQGEMDGEPLEIAGAAVGGVFTGVMARGGGEIRCLRLAPLEPADLDRLVGLYEGDGKSLLVTWREYGGLRAIDLETGRAEALFPVSSRAFLSLNQIETLDASEPFFRFPRDSAGAIQALVRGDWRSPETLLRKGDVTQQRVHFLSGEIELAGTLLVPRHGTSLPAAVLVHGSGPIYRSALIERALWLVENGFAAFVYDKRGTGASEGDRRDDDHEILTADIEAAVAAVREHPAVDANQVGLYGHSQAGFLIPRVAAADPRLAFAVVVNGGGIRPGEQSLFDKRNDLERAGYAEVERQDAIQLMREMFAYFRDQEGDRATLETAYLKAKEEPWFPLTDLPDVPGIPSWENPPKEMVAYSRELNFDPTAFQRAMRQPVLVLLAEEDQTVPAEEVATRWQESLESAGNPMFEVRLLTDVDHGMRLTSGPRQGQLSPEYKRTLGRWLTGLLHSTARESESG